MCAYGNAQLLSYTFSKVDNNKWTDDEEEEEDNKEKEEQEEEKTEEGKSEKETLKLNFNWKGILRPNN